MCVRANDSRASCDMNMFTKKKQKHPMEKTKRKWNETLQYLVYNSNELVHFPSCQSIRCFHCMRMCTSVCVCAVLAWNLYVFLSVVEVDHSIYIEKRSNAPNTAAVLKFYFILFSLFFLISHKDAVFCSLIIIITDRSQASIFANKIIF